MDHEDLYLGLSILRHLLVYYEHSSILERQQGRKQEHCHERNQWLPCSRVKCASAKQYQR